MSSPFLGMIALFPYNFALRGWAFCDGTILSIAQNMALFSLIGTTFGGNGTTTFALPDLRGRVPNSSGQGPGLSNYDLGQVGGTESTTLTVNEMPMHNHQVNATDASADLGVPGGNILAGAPRGTNIYTAAAPDQLMSPTVITNTGGNLPVGILQPYLTLNYCIALEGIFPSRN